MPKHGVIFEPRFCILCHPFLVVTIALLQRNASNVSDKAATMIFVVEIG